MLHVLIGLLSATAPAIEIVAGALQISLNSTSGLLALSVGGAAWFDGGLAVMRDGATWYSSAPPGTPNASIAAAGKAAYGKLELASVSAGAAGTDALGAYGATTTLHWVAASSGGGKRMDVSFRPYPARGAIVVRQAFPDGLAPGNKHGALDQVVSSGLTLSRSRAPLRAILYQGTQLQLTSTAQWPAGGALAVPPPASSDPPYSGSPFVAHDAALGALALGPLDNHFTTVRRPATDGGLDGAFACGFHGRVADLPAGYAHETMLAADAGSVRRALRAYGDGLLAAGNARGGGKTREGAAALRAADVGISHLGYYTDNGAFYYYNTVASKAGGAATAANETKTCSCCVPHLNGPTPTAGCDSWQSTIADVKSYLGSIGVPARYVQLDSWWYRKAQSNSGCDLWEPRPDAFPSGLDPNGVEHWPLVLHNRFFSADSVYAANFSFAPAENGVICPTDPRFFPHIMGRAKKWGMVTYEQDFLTKTLTSVTALSSNLTLAATWLGLMDAAAAQLNVTVQYCMAQPQHVLQSAALPRVTNGRASKDYNADRDQWSYFPLNAMLYGAVGLAPFKDDFWSTPVQPGNPWGESCVEFNPELMALVSTLSTGPVGPADKVGLVNASLVLQTCRADGLLLKPAEPLAPMDAAFKQAFDDDAGLPPSKAAPAATFAGVWPASTFSAPATVANAAAAPTHFYVVNAVRTAPLSLAPADLGAPAGATLFAFEYYAAQRGGNPKQRARFAVAAVTAAAPLTLRPIGDPAVTHGADVPFELHVLAVAPPNPATTWTIVGEAAKYVAAAPQRFHSITYGGSSSSSSGGGGGGASAELLGAAGEAVAVMVLPPASTTVAYVDCTIGADGTATLACGATAKCTCS
jgi:hypothetical protein